MSALTGLFASGRAADVVLLAMAAEAALLAVTGRAMRQVFAALLPGVLLVLALRGALAGAAWPWIAVPLTLSLPAHLAYIRGRGWLGRNATQDGGFVMRPRNAWRGRWARVH